MRTIRFQPIATAAWANSIESGQNGNVGKLILNASVSPLIVRGAPRRKVAQENLRHPRQLRLRKLRRQKKRTPPASERFLFSGPRVSSHGVSPDYLLVDGHSIIFAWPELRTLHERRGAAAREALVKKLRDYQDWSGARVVVVFDGRGLSVSEEAMPGEIQIFYSRAGQTADSIIERLASKYADRFRLVVATGDFLEQETASASGAETVSPDGLRELLQEARPRRQERRPPR